MIGLDIGSKYIKICRIERRDGLPYIITAMRSQVQLDQAGGKAAIGLRIKEMLKYLKTSARITALSLSSSQLLARDMSFPAMPRQELEGAVNLEAEQSIFSDLKSMYTDFLVLSKPESENADVLFVAVPRAMVDEVLSDIKLTGLDPQVMDIDNLALANCYLEFEPNSAASTVVLLNIGYSSANISIVDRGNLRFIRNVDVGGRNIILDIASRYNVPEAVAEEIMKQPDMWPKIGLNMKNVLRKSIPTILEDVYKSIEYCMSRNKVVNIDKLLITGGVSKLPGIEDFIAESLGIVTEKWNPLNNAGIQDAGQRESGCFLAVALGLALRKVNNV